MGTFHQLSSEIRTIFAILFMIATVLSIWVAINSVRLNLSKRLSLFTIFQSIVLSLKVVAMGHFSVATREGELQSLLGYNIANFSWFLLLLLWIFAMVLIYFEQIYVRLKQHSMITPFSIVESFDSLSDGVCYATPDGVQILVNKAMNDISYYVFNREVLDIEKFWYELFNSEKSKQYDIIGENMIHLKNDKVYSFERNTLDIEGHLIFEIIATDISQEYALHDEIKLQNKKAEDYNHRMRELNDLNKQLINQEETLNAKLKVHNDLTTALKEFRKYISTPVDERKRDKLLYLWRYPVSVLNSLSTDKQSLLDWELIIQRSKNLHIEIIKKGEIPSIEPAKTLFLRAVNECMKNAVSHAQATELYVYTTKTENAITVMISNNGRIPRQLIIEKGGLRRLRESVGNKGTMTIQSMPQFVLYLLVPLQDNSK